MGLELRDLGQEYCVWDALLQISLEAHPTSYLEVGSRYGDSLLRVLIGCAPRKLDRIVIADIWHDSYFGQNNNGTHFDQSHKHIERMFTSIGYGPEQVLYLDGDSAKTIPFLDKRQPFDLVLVDGDHAYPAATADLFNCWPLVAPGGYLVFDDIGSDQGMADLYTSFTKNVTDVAASYIRVNKKFGVAVTQKESRALETSKVRSQVLQYFHGDNGIDIGCSRDPLTRYCVAYDRSDWPEVTHRGEADKLPFEDKKFDWLWSSHCLEDFEDTSAILAEWLRVLKHGAAIGLYVPHPDFYPGGNSDHKHLGFRIEELTGMLRSMDCEPIMTKLDNEEPNHYSSLVIARKL